MLDEVQHVPELLSYLQVEVDARPEAGRFVLTGSQHFGLAQGISQSLAGRTGVLHLLPLSLDEVRRFPSPPADLVTTLLTGDYPRIHDRAIPAGRWLADYVTTYVQRDVRQQVLNVGDLQTLTNFVRLCAGRTAQEINLSALGSDAGVSHNTVRAWLSVLEQSFLCFRLPPWHRNLTTQLVKTPKLHFFDSGLVCDLLGIQQPEQLLHHPLRGAIFESWVASETRGLEVDLLTESASGLVLVEVKSGATLAADFFGPLRKLAERFAQRGTKSEQRLVYGGELAQQRTNVKVIPWAQIADASW